MSGQFFGGMVTAVLLIGFGLLAFSPFILSGRISEEERRRIDMAKALVASGGDCLGLAPGCGACPVGSFNDGLCRALAEDGDYKTRTVEIAKKFLASHGIPVEETVPGTEPGSLERAR